MEVLVNLGFRRLEPDRSGPMLPVSFAVLMVGVAARQATSPTARLAMRIDRPTSVEGSLFQQRGPFNAATAAALSNWQGE